MVVVCFLQMCIMYVGVIICLRMLVTLRGVSATVEGGLMAVLSDACRDCLHWMCSDLAGAQYLHVSLYSSHSYASKYVQTCVLYGDKDVCVRV